jgi:hypothetical protein
MDLQHVGAAGRFRLWRLPQWLRARLCHVGRRGPLDAVNGLHGPKQVAAGASERHGVVLAASVKFMKLLNAKAGKLVQSFHRDHTKVGYG